MNRLDVLEIAKAIFFPPCGKVGYRTRIGLPRVRVPDVRCEKFDEAFRGARVGCNCANLVSMTRNFESSGSKPVKPQISKLPPGHWLLQDAKARFSELVRKVRSEGPQHVTVHGRDEVVVIAAEEFRRLQGSPTGRALIDALQSSPYRDIDIELERAPMPVRDVAL